MRLSNRSDSILRAQGHLFFCCLGPFITVFLPRPALTYHFNHCFSNTPPLFIALIFPQTQGQPGGMG